MTGSVTSSEPLHCIALCLISKPYFSPSATCLLTGQASNHMARIVCILDIYNRGRDIIPDAQSCIDKVHALNFQIWICMASAFMTERNRSMLRYRWMSSKEMKSDSHIMVTWCALTFQESLEHISLSRGWLLATDQRPDATVFDQITMHTNIIDTMKEIQFIWHSNRYSPNNHPPLDRMINLRRWILGWAATAFDP